MIWVVHPGSGSWVFTHPRSRIQESKRHRIPDPDPQHCIFDYFVHLYILALPWIFNFFFFLSASDASFVDREFCFSTPNSKSSARSQLGNAADKLSYSEDEDDQPAAFTSVVASPLGRMHVSDLPNTANTSGHDLSDYREDVTTEHSGVTPDDQFSPSAEARGDQFSNFHDKMSTGNGR
jgi:hypothetical protein